LLKQHDIPYDYREYRDQPLSVDEMTVLLTRLGVGPREVLRTHDRAYKELGLKGDESDSRLVELMSSNPTLLQRPIGVYGDRAVVGRPAERLVEIVEVGGQ